MERVPQESAQAPRLSRADRERQILDTAAELFYARGVHEVGMDELVRATGLGKATVYRLFATKDELIAAYLRRLASSILTIIDKQIAARPDEPGGVVRAIFAAVSDDVARPTFRGCPFNNASIEFADPEHPARIVARQYRAELQHRLTHLAEHIQPAGGAALGAQLALLIDGMYVSAAHLGPDGPAAAAPGLAEALLGPRSSG